MLLDIKNNPLWLAGPDCGITLYSTEGNDGRIEVRECAGLRWLHFQNGSVETVMSLEDPNRLVLDYIRAMMVILVFIPRPATLLNLGLGGGAIHRFCKKHLPQTQVTTVEANKEVVDICREYFHLDQEAENIYISDAQSFLQSHLSDDTPTTYDGILVDLFCNEGIAPCLFDPDFFNQIKQTLSESGIAVFNIIVDDQNHLNNIFTHIWKAFSGKALCFNLEDCSNVLVMGFGSEEVDRKVHTIYRNANSCCELTQVNFRNYVDILVRCNGTKNGKLKFIAS